MVVLVGALGTDAFEFRPTWRMAEAEEKACHKYGVTGDKFIGCFFGALDTDENGYIDDHEMRAWFDSIGSFYRGVAKRVNKTPETFMERCDSMGSPGVITRDEAARTVGCLDTCWTRHGLFWLIGCKA